MAMARGHRRYRLLRDYYCSGGRGEWVEQRKLCDKIEIIKAIFYHKTLPPGMEGLNRNRWPNEYRAIVINTRSKLYRRTPGTDL